VGALGIRAVPGWQENLQEKSGGNGAAGHLPTKRWSPNFWEREGVAGATVDEQVC